MLQDLVDKPLLFRKRPRDQGARPEAPQTQAAVGEEAVAIVAVTTKHKHRFVGKDKQ